MARPRSSNSRSNVAAVAADTKDDVIVQHIEPIIQPAVATMQSPREYATRAEMEILVKELADSRHLLEHQMKLNGDLMEQLK